MYFRRIGYIKNANDLLSDDCGAWRNNGKHEFVLHKTVHHYWKEWNPIIIIIITTERGGLSGENSNKRKPYSSNNNRDAMTNDIWQKITQYESDMRK